MSSSRPRAIASSAQAPPAVRSVLPVQNARKINKSVPAVSRKGKEKAPNQDDIVEDPVVEPPPPQKKRKRAPPARIASPALTSISSPSPPPASFVRPPPAESLLDLLGTSSIPHNGMIARTQGAMDRLEMGNNRSALHDVAKLQLDLSKNLVEWEAARLRQSRIEEDEMTEERKREVQVARARQERRKQKQIVKERRIAEGGGKEMETDESEEDDAGIPKKEEQSDDEVPPCPPLTAYDLARVSRWPLVPSVLPPDEFTIGEELLALLEVKSRQIALRNDEPERPPRDSTRSRSAYAIDGPLATTDDISSASDSEDSINSDDSFSLTPDRSRIITTLASTMDSLLHAMAKETTPCYFPPTDYWEAKMVKDAWRTKPPKKGMDFNDVVRLVEDMKVIPQAVKDLLAEQLYDLYGPDAHPDLPGSPIEAPPATNDWPTTSTIRLRMQGAEQFPEYLGFEPPAKKRKKK